MSPRYVGSPIEPLDNERFLTGRACYLADTVRPDMLHVSLVRSPHAHGHVRSVDVTRARRMSGVAGVFTAADLPDVIGPLRSDRLHGARPVEVPALAADRVRAVGDPVAAVVAEDRYVAEDAAEAVEVAYDELPVVIDAEAALAAGAPVLYRDWEDNVLVRHGFATTSVDDALSSSACVIRERFSTQRYAAMPLETRGCVADWSGEQLVLSSSTQMPFVVRSLIAEAIGLPEGRIRVVAPDVGGGFGTKMHVYREELLVSALSIALRRPVCWIEDRAEHLVASVHARELTYDVEAGLDGSGRLQVVRARVLADMGSAAVFFPGVAPAVAAGWCLPGPYRLEEFEIDVTCVVTNKTPTGAYRGFGQPEAAFVIERVLDIAARQSGLDPREIRARNLIRPGDMPYRSATGARLDGGDYPLALGTALNLARYDERRSQQAAERKRGRHLGLGIACYVEGTAPSLAASTGRWGAGERITLRVEPDGLLTLLCALPSQGQAQRTTLAQVVADELGVRPEEVTVEAGDTGIVPHGLGTWGSRSAVVGGAAALLAASALRERLLAVAALLLEAAADDLELADRKIRVRGTTHAISLRAIADACYHEPSRFSAGTERTLETVGTYDPPEVDAAPDSEGRMNDCTTYGYAVQVAFVEVDAELGTVDVLDYVVVHDCGQMINPAVVEGQLRGGVAQGIGAALWECTRYGCDGRPISTALDDYFLPTALDVPRIQIAHLETPAPGVPGGFRGVGESGIIGAPAAIAGAVEDALAPFGTRLRALPLRPEDLAAARRGAKERAC